MLKIRTKPVENCLLITDRDRETERERKRKLPLRTSNCYKAGFQVFPKHTLENSGLKQAKNVVTEF